MDQVHETRGNCPVVDTGHSRPINNTSDLHLQSPSQSSHRSFHTPPARRRTTVPGRSASSSPRRRRPTVPEGPLTRGGAGRSLVDVGEVSNTVNYVMDVKRALASEPHVYRQFIHTIQRYHHGQRGANDSGRLDLDNIRQIVSLLRTRPQLVLNFNEFLPDGYRIRMFDQFAYVIECPDSRLTVAI